MKILSPKAAVVIISIIAFVALGQFIQCKTTKADTRNSVDMSGDADDFNDAIEKKYERAF